MLKQGSGHIVQITTSLDENASSSAPSVLASLTKGGLNAATRSLAIEYASKGIRVNAAARGAIKTPMHAPETFGFLAKLHPIGRMGELRDVVDAVLYLEGAAFATGEILHVDGGQSAGHSAGNRVAWMGAAASIRDFEVSLQWRAEFIHLGMTLSLRREAALDEIAVAAALLFTKGQTTERTFVTAERLGRAE